MKQLTTLDRIGACKPLVSSKAQIKCRDLLYPLLMLLAGTKVKYRLHVENSYSPLPQKPIIFAATHAAFPDIPLALRATGRRSVIFAGKQHLDWIDWLFFTLNGVIWVDRHSRADRAASRQALLSTLQTGQSILWFPEATWNLTANQLIMPLRWGIVETAREANAQIIPVALHYDRVSAKCFVRFGNPLANEMLDDRVTGICILRDAMASLRWELMAMQPTLQRTTITPEQLQAELESAIPEYPPLDWEYERTCIFQPHEKRSAVPDTLIPSHANMFLFHRQSKG